MSKLSWVCSRPVLDLSSSLSFGPDALKTNPARACRLAFSGFMMECCCNFHDAVSGSEQLKVLLMIYLFNFSERKSLFWLLPRRAGLCYLLRVYADAHARVRARASPSPTTPLTTLI